MKSILSIAVAAAAILAVPSIAGAKDCGSAPSKLSLPNGASASEEEMKATAAKFPAYQKAVVAFMTCHADEAKAAKADYENTSADWSKQQAAFKAAPAK